MLPEAAAKISPNHFEDFFKWSLKKEHRRFFSPLDDSLVLVEMNLVNFTIFCSTYSHYRISVFLLFKNGYSNWNIYKMFEPEFTIANVSTYQTIFPCETTVKC